MQVRAYKRILVSVDAGVATVTLNRPERRNALGTQMTNELLYALEDAALTDDVRCTVLTGAGSAFCAGADLAELRGDTDALELPLKGGYDDLLREMLRTTKPIIARVNGHALGGGLGLVAASTLAIASTEASLGAPEAKLGLFPFMIYAALERVMARRPLLELLLCGQRLSAAEAVRAGLLNRAVAPAELDAAVEALTDEVRAASPSALRLGLSAVHEVEGLPLEDQLPLLARRLVECLATPDAGEGLTAFLEKRPPRWTEA
ncbi:MAG TPA: enoyl-CoA hydratase-related protein [Polyangiales bacterium]|nr:enoyl-CoA hydratase-related protein [Polyangiales bacterium]